MSIMALILLLFIMLILLILLLAYYFGVFKKITCELQAIGPFKILYYQLQCNYSSLGKHFQKLNQISIDENFKQCDTMGLYYDNPYQISNPDQCRSCICIVVNKINNEKIQNCCKKYENLKYAELPETKAIAATPFPYKGFLTFFVFPFKVYPKLGEFYNTRPKDETPESCSLEYYPSDPNNSKNFLSIQGYMPLTNKAKQYCLSEIPRPLYKQDEMPKEKEN